MVGQGRAGFVLEAAPVAALRDLDAALVGHLQEEQVGELLDVVAVIDAVVAQGVAEAPEFVDDVGHECFLNMRSTGLSDAAYYKPVGGASSRDFL